MVKVTFFRDINWKIQGYTVFFCEPRNSDVDNKVKGLMLGAKLALQELKAYYSKVDSSDVQEVIVTRTNKNTIAALKPFELGVKYLEDVDPREVEVKQF